MPDTSATIVFDAWQMLDFGYLKFCFTLTHLWLNIILLQCYNFVSSIAVDAGLYLLILYIQMWYKTSWLRLLLRDILELFPQASFWLFPYLASRALPYHCPCKCQRFMTCLIELSLDFRIPCCCHLDLDLMTFACLLQIICKVVRRSKQWTKWLPCFRHANPPVVYITVCRYAQQVTR